MTRFVFVGDYSGLSLFLARGMERLGLEVAFLSNGDHWKNIPRQQNIWRPSTHKLGSLANQLLDFPALLRSVGKDDVLLLATEYLFTQPLNGLMLARCMQRAGKVVLLHAGCSHNFNAAFNDTALCQSCKQHDLQSRHCKFEYQRWPWLTSALQRLDLVVPFTSIYAPSAHAYRLPGTHVTAPLHFPVDIEYLQATASPRPTAAVIHGTNRPGFKGTVHLQALMQAQPALASAIHITERMSFVDFLGTVASTQLVLDQLLANGYGMTGAIALALGTAVAFGHTVAAPDPEFCGPGCVPFQVSMQEQPDAAALSAAIGAYLAKPAHPDDMRALCRERHDHVAIAHQLVQRIQSSALP